jgi:hypothetical protein
MVRLPQLLPGGYEPGVRCTVDVRIGQVWRAVRDVQIPQREYQHHRIG